MLHGQRAASMPEGVFWNRMSTQPAISVEQYLSTSFDGRDKEYVDGELVERGMPDIFHSIVQGWLLWIFNQLAQTKAVFACPEIRLRLGPQLYRIPDIAVFEHQLPAGRFPDSPPLLVVEIVSEDDRHSEMIQKLEEYRNWGVRHVWVVDPRLRELFVCSEVGLQRASCFALPEYDLTITIHDLMRGLPAA